MFKVGDLVKMRAAHADGRPNIKFKGAETAEFVIEKMDEHDKFFIVRVTVPGKVIFKEVGKQHGLYEYRFEHVVKEIVPGCVVKYVGKDATKNGEYVCQGLQPGLIKVVGIRNWMKVESFCYHAPPPVVAPPVVLDEGEEFLKELDKQVGGNPGTCSYAVKFVGGKKSFHVRDVCHARISRTYAEHNDLDVTHLALNLSGHYNKLDEANKEIYKTYIDWLVNRSFLKNAFVPRSIDKMLKDGVLMNVSQNINVLATAAVATRHVTEFPHFRTAFGKVVDLGFSEEVALIVSTFFKEDKDCVVVNDWGGGHHFLCANMDWEEVVACFNKGFPEKDEVKPYVKFNKGYRVFTTISPTNDMAKLSVSKFLKSLKGCSDVKTGWGSVKGISGKNALVKVCAQLAKHF